MYALVAFSLRIVVPKVVTECSKQLETHTIECPITLQLSMSKQIMSTTSKKLFVQLKATQIKILDYKEFDCQQLNFNLMFKCSLRCSEFYLDPYVINNQFLFIIHFRIINYEIHNVPHHVHPITQP